MKIIVTHTSPDWDAIGSVWLIKKYLSGWQDAVVKFVPAGERFARGPVGRFPRPTASFSASGRISPGARRGFPTPVTPCDPIEIFGEDEVIHVDTGMGPLDHHQISDSRVCAMSLTWDYIQKEIKGEGNKFTPEHLEAVTRVVRIVIDIDHFGEVFWENPAADYHEFSLLGLMEGLKYMRPDQDNFYIDFGITCLNAEVINFENRIWAEKEIEKGKRFLTRYGKAIGFETVNDTVLKLAQKMGFVIVVRKDPRKGYIRIKTLPDKQGKKGADLTLAYEQLKKIDPDATWFLHVSGKMLLNGTPKNPRMKPTKLGLDDIIRVLEKI